MARYSGGGNQARQNYNPGGGATDSFGNPVSLANNRPSNQQLIQQQAQQLANEMIAEMQLAEQTAALGRIYTNFKVNMKK